MEKNYSNYTDAELLKIMDDSYNLDDSIFFVLTELGLRKNPKTENYCLNILNEYIGIDEFFVSSALSTLYNFNENVAIDFAINNYRKLKNHSLGGLISLLWVDSKIYKENPKKEELIFLIKEHLESFSQDEIDQIKGDYDEFMKAYKEV